MSGSSKKNKSKFNALFRSVRVGDTSALSNNNSSKKRTDNEHNDLILSEEKDIEKSNETGLENVNGTQTEHKRNTKLGFNSENKQTIKNRNGTQTEYKLNKEKVIKSNSKDKTEHKRNTKLGFISENKQTLKNKNGTQTEHKRNTADALKGGTAEKLESQPKKFNGGFIADETPSIDLLSSIQQSVLMVMYDSAKENNMDFTTGKLTINGIANKAGVNSRSIKTTIARLKDKYYISISSRKDGRGGWVSYRLQRGVFFEIKNSLLSESPEENNHTVPKYEIDNQSTVISDLDLAGLEEFGFKKVHFNNLTNKLSIEEIQESINHFSWGLRFNPKNEKYKKDAINVLIGCLVKKSIWIEKNYKSDDEIRLDKKLAYEKEKAERIKKKEEELFNEKFKAWSDGLTDHEIKQIIPNLPTGKLAIKPMITAGLRKYYKDNLWSSEILTEIN
ncbi:hypothetical protein [Piscirickettsia salmonis]|uniref:hypothetical protein n=1 Tax=Piscirickettsia salmonis TaxID=1238 RepID=UPI0012B97061|nr:hypothetical protein [Piscirickettsia salmonis]